MQELINELHQAIEEAKREYGDLPVEFEIDLDTLDSSQLQELKQNFIVWLGKMQSRSEELTQENI